MFLVNQLMVDKRDYERMRVQVAHNSVALNESSARADSAGSTTLLMRGKPEKVAMNAAKLK